MAFIFMKNRELVRGTKFQRFTVFKLKLTLIQADLGLTQNMKVLDLFVSYNSYEESIFKFFLDFKL